MNDLKEYKWFQWSKIFSLIAFIKEDDVLLFLILRPILDHILGSKKDKLFSPVFVYRWGMSNAICDLVLYLQSEGLNISWIYPSTTPSQYLIKNGIRSTVFYSITNQKPVYFSKVLDGYDRYGSIWDLGGKFRVKQIHLFCWALWSLSVKFFSKRGNHEEHLQSKCGWISALHNSLLYPVIRYLL